MNLRQTAVLMGHNAPIYALLPYGDEGEQWLSAAGDGWVVVWDLRAGVDGRLLMQVEGSIFCLHRLHNAQELAVGTMQGGLYWLDLATNTPLMQELAHAGGIFALHSDADHLYTGGGDGRLVRWSRTTRRKIETLHLSHKPLRCFCPSPTARCYGSAAATARFTPSI